MPLSDLLAGQIVLADDVKAITDALHPVKAGPTSTSSTSTSYEAGTELSLTIPYPQSGIIVVNIYARFYVSANTGWLSFEIRDTDGSGTVREAASDAQALTTRQTDSTGDARSASFVVSGLPTSGTAFIQLMHRITSSGTVTYPTRRLWAQAGR